MAVVKEWRRRGIGAMILNALVDEARKRGHKEVVLAAQLQAAEFYREQGFVAEVYESLHAIIPLPEIGCELPLAEIYEGIEFVPEAPRAEE